MAVKITEVASFDIDTDSAVKSINQYINGLKKLEAQRDRNIKAGKSVVTVNRQIDKSIDQINKSLKQETSTLKGNVAQLESVRKVQNDISRSSKKRLNLMDKEIKKRKAITSSIASQRRAFSQIKFLAVGAAVGIVASLGQIGTALENLNALFDSTVALQNNMAEATKDTVKEYVKEKAALDNKFDAVNAATVGTREHKDAVNDIVEQYGPYLSDLAKEELALGNSKRAQDEATKSILKRLAAQTKLAVAEKLIGQIIDSQIEQMNRTAQANTGVSQGIEDIAKQQGNLAKTFIDPFGLFDEQIDAVTEKIPDLSEGITDIQNKATQLKTTSAIEQLKKLGKVSDEFLAEFLQGFDGLADIFGDFKEGTDDATKGTTKATKEVKDLSGTLAGLSKQLSDAKKVLQEGIQITDTKALQEQQGFINDLEKQIKDLQTFLKNLDAEPIPIGELEFFEPDLDTLFTLDSDKVTESLQKGLDQLTISDLKAKIEGAEIEGLIDIEQIEDARNEALKLFQGTEQERDELNERFSQKRLNRERQTAREVLTLQLKILQAERLISEKAGESLDAFDRQIAELNLKLTELDRKEVEIKVNAETGDAEEKINKVKDTVNFVADGVEQLGGAIIQFFQQQTDAALNKLEGDVQRQQAFLDELLGQQEGANAQQVELERDRLDNLVAEREKAVERQAAIAQLEIALNAAIAIARAAAEGGAGAAITIAATLISLAVGFAQAKATASQAFASGSDYVTRGKGERPGTDTVHAMLNEGEAVIQTDKNRTYSSAVKAIRRGSIDPSLMHDFVTNPDKYKEFASTHMAPSLQRRMDMSGVSLAPVQGGMNKKHSDRMVKEIQEMKEMMGQITVSEWKVKGKQFARVVTSVQDKNRRNANRFK